MYTHLPLVLTHALGLFLVCVFWGWVRGEAQLYLITNWNNWNNCSSEPPTRRGPAGAVPILPGLKMLNINGM